MTTLIKQKTQKVLLMALLLAALLAPNGFSTSTYAAGKDWDKESKPAGVHKSTDDTSTLSDTVSQIIILAAGNWGG